MSDLIRREDVYSKYTELKKAAGHEAIDTITADEISRLMIQAVDNAPAVDAVPVVRCKDCKYRIPWDGIPDAFMCRMFGLVFDSACCEDDFFCKDGERKDGAE